MKKGIQLILTIITCSYFWNCARTYTQWHFIDNVNLIFHEAGHTIFMFFGEFITVLAGSAFQVIIPLSIAIYFFFRNEKVQSMICMLWVGQSLLNVSVYAGDATNMQLELLGGDSSNHDWNYLLSKLDLLEHTKTVAYMIYQVGFLTIFIATIFAILFVIKKDINIFNFNKKEGIN